MHAKVQLSCAHALVAQRRQQTNVTIRARSEDARSSLAASSSSSLRLERCCHRWIWLGNRRMRRHDGISHRPKGLSTTRVHSRRQRFGINVVSTSRTDAEYGCPTLFLRNDAPICDRLGSDFALSSKRFQGMFSLYRVNSSFHADTKGNYGHNRFHQVEYWLNAESYQCT